MCHGLDLLCYVDAVDSIEKTFSNCLTSMSDFKELIPEFYMSNGEFLQNVHRINFGTRQDRQPVNDVELPPWAKSMYAESVVISVMRSSMMVYVYFVRFF